MAGDSTAGQLFAGIAFVDFSGNAKNRLAGTLVCAQAETDL
jgi:hypothetical protein